MKTLKSNLLIMLTIMIVFMPFVSCNKEQSFVEPELHADFSQMSLKDFAAFVESEDEKVFFQKHGIIDNTKTAEKAIFEKSILKSEASGAWITFRWHGSGCVNPLGICIIIPAPWYTETKTTNSYESERNASVYMVDGKYVIFPLTDENGVTKDGYLPIFDDIYVDENITIKAGIYKAYYDEFEEKYTAIALDLK